MIPYTDAATTISARRGILQSVRRRMIRAACCFKTTVRATVVCTQELARYAPAITNPCIGITQSASGLSHGALTQCRYECGITSSAKQQSMIPSKQHNTVGTVADDRRYPLPQMRSAHPARSHARCALAATTYSSVGVTQRSPLRTNTHVYRECHMCIECLHTCALIRRNPHTRPRLQ